MIIGIDIGNKTGYCVMGRDMKIIMSGSKGVNNLIELHDFLEGLIVEETEVIVTDTILLKSGAIAFEKMGILKYIAEKKKKPIISMPANRMRKLVLGKFKKTGIRKDLKEKYGIEANNVHHADAIISCIAYIKIAK